MFYRVILLLLPAEEEIIQRQPSSSESGESGGPGEGEGREPSEHTTWKMVSSASEAKQQFVMSVPQQQRH